MLKKLMRPSPLLFMGLAAFTAIPALAPQIAGAQAANAPPAAPDLGTQPTLYVVGYAHLDTQWRWDYVTTIREYLPKTMRLNFDWFEKYPHYVFNFSGANRYRLMKEYYPADYELVKKYVAAGRWFPAGSSMEENDVNNPSAESIIRQILYGKEFFRREFGKTSAEYMLPDCFGFPASLPSILAHCGIKGFSTQKLASYGSAAPGGGAGSPENTPVGVPFNVGVWQGPDGNFVVAALNPGGYGAQITTDLTKTPPQGRRGTDWPARIDVNGKLTGTFVDYMYYGTGDTGGSASEATIKLLEAILTKSQTRLPPQATGRGGAAPIPAATGPEILVGDGPVRIVAGPADQMFLDLKPEQIAKLPTYKGDLELINHSAGSITSQTHMKRWNRMNEILAGAAEQASVAAELFGGRPYPMERLTDAWTLVMGGQFHDVIPGTALPKAYEYSWNDELLAMNQFAGVLTSASEAVAAGMDTRAQGSAIVVYNALNIPRQDVVEATVAFPGNVPAAVRVLGPDGKEVPAQIKGSAAGGVKVLFLASMPSAGYAVYDVRPADTAPPSSLKVTPSSLENARYRVAIDANGDVTSIFDKSLNKELLAARMQLAIILDNPRNWPAWNMDFADEQRPPRTVVSGPANIRIVEDGPARVAVEVARQAEGSTFTQTIRLAAGDAGNRVEFGHVMDWNTKAGNLKAVFPLTAANVNATYNWDVGTVERPTETQKQFEVASHQFVDLTDAGGDYGVTILTDCKNASDKPDDHTLRLTLVRTPGTQGSYTDQGSQDIGHHEFVYGLAGHAGSFRQGQTDWQALRLNQPLIAFQSPAHAGALGRSLSLLQVSNSRIRVLAFKKAELMSAGNQDEYVVRLVEMDGKPASDVRLTFFTPVVSAREVTGAEEDLGPATVTNGAVVTSFKGFQPRTFAVKFAPLPPANKMPAPQWQAVKLTYDQCVATPDGRPGAGYWDAQGNSLPAEMLPTTLAYAGINFALAPNTHYGQHNAVIARGQQIALPAGDFNRLYLLAAAAPSSTASTSSTAASSAPPPPRDVTANFLVGNQTIPLRIQDWSGYIGQWDNRTWTTRLEAVATTARAGSAATSQPRRLQNVDVMTGLIPGYIRPASVAWFASHRHGPDGRNEPYSYAYLFAYALDLAPGAATLTLPTNERIRILAVTVSDEGAQLRPAQILTDYLER